MESLEKASDAMPRGRLVLYAVRPCFMAMPGLGGAQAWRVMRVYASSAEICVAVFAHGNGAGKEMAEMYARHLMTNSIEVA